jgi:hypothetical protein
MLYKRKNAAISGAKNAAGKQLLMVMKKTVADSEVRKVTGGVGDWQLSCAWMMQSAISKTRAIKAGRLCGEPQARGTSD